MTHWEKIELAIQEQGVSPNFAFEIGGVGPACRFVSERVGIAIVSDLMAREYLEILGLCVRPLSPGLNHEFVGVNREMDVNSSITKKFTNILQAAAKVYEPLENSQNQTPT